MVCLREGKKERKNFFSFWRLTLCRRNHERAKKGVCSLSLSLSLSLSSVRSSGPSHDSKLDRKEKWVKYKKWKERKSFQVKKVYAMRCCCCMCKSNYKYLSSVSLSLCLSLCLFVFLYPFVYNVLADINLFHIVKT